VYDNLRAAVRKIVGGERQLTKRFEALVSHYLFEPCFARVGEGHDKGGVESRGKAIRLQHLAPVPRGKDLEQDFAGDSGHSRATAFVIRCQGEDNRPRCFSTWAFARARPEVTTLNLVGVGRDLAQGWTRSTDSGGSLAEFQGH